MFVEREGVAMTTTEAESEGVSYEIASHRFRGRCASKGVLIMALARLDNEVFFKRAFANPLEMNLK